MDTAGKTTMPEVLAWHGRVLYVLSDLVRALHDGQSQSYKTVNNTVGGDLQIADQFALRAIVRTSGRVSTVTKPGLVGSKEMVHKLLGVVLQKWGNTAKVQGVLRSMDDVESMVNHLESICSIL